MPKITPLAGGRLGVLSQTCAPLPALVLSSIPTLGHVAAASVSCFAKECDGVDFSGAYIYKTKLFWNEFNRSR